MMKQKMLTHNRRFLYKLIPTAPEAGVKEADALECAVSAGSLRVAAGGAFLFFWFDVDAAGLDIAADLPDVVHRDIAQFIELFTCEELTGSSLFDLPVLVLPQRQDGAGFCRCNSLVHGAQDIFVADHDALEPA